MIHITLAAEKLFSIGSFPVTNALISSLIVSIGIIILFYRVGQSVSLYPKSRLAQAAEGGVEIILYLVEQVTRDRKKAEQWLPLLATFFIFILLNNWFGLVPGVGSIFISTSEGATPILRGANADLNTTLALAIVSVLVTQAYAIRALGLFRHLSKYFSLHPMKLLIGLIELISEVAKMISFSFRLFGNIIAGEVLLAVIAYLVPFAAPLPFLAFELFVGIIQALVFMMLTLVFLATATEDHGETATLQHTQHTTAPEEPLLSLPRAPVDNVANTA